MYVSEYKLPVKVIWWLLRQHSQLPGDNCDCVFITETDANKLTITHAMHFTAFAIQCELFACLYLKLDYGLTGVINAMTLLQKRWFSRQKWQFGWNFISNTLLPNVRA